MKDYVANAVSVVSAVSTLVAIMHRRSVEHYVIRSFWEYAYERIFAHLPHSVGIKPRSVDDHFGMPGLIKSGDNKTLAYSLDICNFRAKDKLGAVVLCVLVSCYAKIPRIYCAGRLGVKCGSDALRKSGLHRLGLFATHKSEPRHIIFDALFVFLPDNIVCIRPIAHHKRARS